MVKFVVKLSNYPSYKYGSVMNSRYWIIINYKLVKYELYSYDDIKMVSNIYGFSILMRAFGKSFF